MTTVVNIAKGQTAVLCPFCAAPYTGLDYNMTQKDCTCSKCKKAFRVKRG